jgi:hypothetical protein
LISAGGVFCVFFTNARTTITLRLTGRDIESAGYSVTAGQPQLPQLSLQVFHVRLAQAFQARLADSIGKPKEPRLHVRRKRCDLSRDNFVQDFDAPRHARIYLIFKISGRGGAQ